MRKLAGGALTVTGPLTTLSGMVWGDCKSNAVPPLPTRRRGGRRAPWISLRTCPSRPPVPIHDPGEVISPTGSYVQLPPTALQALIRP